MKPEIEKMLEDVRELKTNGMWAKTPDWALTQSKKLGCPPTHSKVIEWAMYQLVDELGKEAAEVETDKPATETTNGTLKSVSEKASSAAASIAHSASGKIKKLGLYLNERLSKKKSVKVVEDGSKVVPDEKVTVSNAQPKSIGS